MRNFINRQRHALPPDNTVDTELRQSEGAPCVTPPAGHEPGMSNQPARQCAFDSQSAESVCRVVCALLRKRSKAKRR